MPRILINEKDYTNPGTPGNYSNYAVLITGFADENKTVNSNDIHEFTSVQNFEDTIGYVPPQKVIKVTEYLENETGTDRLSTERKITVTHYGNQMAYELIKLGYPIVYKVIDSPKDLTKPAFWKQFKDKASYDFRFITHGLLESSDISACVDYYEMQNRLTEVEAAITKLAEIKEAFELEQATNPDLENSNYCEETYLAFRESSNIDNFPGFINRHTSVPYTSFNLAEIMTAKEKAAIEKAVEELVSYSISTADINIANNCIADLAAYVPSTKEDPTNPPGRGDCIALIELDENTYNKAHNGSPESLIIDGIKGMSGAINENNGSYCAMTVPSVVYAIDGDAKFNGNTKFPGAFHYLACFMGSLKKNFAEWYAVAGYTRGVSSYVIDHTTVKLGEIAINNLEPRYLLDDDSISQPQFACNVIANFRGSYYLWGNRTAFTLGSAAGGNDLVASHFLNIRQLCITIKKQLYSSCRRFTFDPNSDTLWVNFVNSIRPTLEEMKANQGVRDYKIIKEPIAGKKAALKAKIRIIPVEAVEDFDIEVSLEDIFGETTVNANESI